jgi:hypothetical protein
MLNLTLQIGIHRPFYLFKKRTFKSFNPQKYKYLWEVNYGSSTM